MSEGPLPSNDKLLFTLAIVAVGCMIMSDTVWNKALPPKQKGQSR